jgi:hypothetical protein
MGDRGQVYVKDSGVYLYTHWSATELVDVVKRAIAKRWRWNDDEYLTRIIFEEMTKGERDTETGYGIGTGKHSDVWRFITVDCSKQLVTVEDEGEAPMEYTFEYIAGGVDA